MKADIHTTPKDFRGPSYRIPRFAFMVRLDGWMLNPQGVWRWVAFTGPAGGTHATRYGWKRVFRWPWKDV